MSASDPAVPIAAHDGWKRVWDNRRLDPSKTSRLSQLMAAGGFDTGFGDISEHAWSAFVLRWARELGITPGTSVFEIGCGAGGFLYELHRMGCSVAGIDQSAALVALARDALPGGRFDVAEAARITVSPGADAVVSCSVFFYFPSLAYAQGVIDRMAAKARRVVAILDVPDAAMREAALAHRKATAGGEEAYKARYDGLDHLYYERRWMADALAGAGLVDIATAPQDIDGYANGRYRFNAWGFLPPATP